MRNLLIGEIIMNIYLDGKVIAEEDLHHEVSGNILCFSQADSKQKIIEKLYHGDGHHSLSIKDGKHTFLESHDEYDFMSLLIPNTDLLEENPYHVEIYFSKDRLLFFFEDSSFMQSFIDYLPEDTSFLISLDNILHRFFLFITESDISRLSAIEDEIEKLEDELTDGKKNNDYTNRIHMLRKQLLILKRYYESFTFLLDDIEENRNKVISPAMMRNFHFFANRVDRLLRTVLNLRDYITQVREAYQAQVDIQQNEIMQYFTIITAIFLPLTVIAGWYGMNVSMPEAAHPWAYPVIIVISALFIIGSIIVFKKRKWL